RCRGARARARGSSWRCALATAPRRGAWRRDGGVRSTTPGRAGGTPPEPALSPRGAREGALAHQGCAARQAHARVRRKGRQGEGQFLWCRSFAWLDAHLREAKLSALNSIDGVCCCPGLDVVPRLFAVEYSFCTKVQA